MSPIQYESFETWEAVLDFLESLGKAPSIVIPDDDIIVMHGGSMLAMAKELHDNMLDWSQAMWEATGGFDD